jgi:hypothetical protein
MKLFSTLALLALCTFSLSAQSFSSPESVEYDDAGQRWFVGQNGSGQIHVYSPGSNTLQSFASGLTSGPHGMEILGNVLYVCDGGSLRGFDLTSGAQVFTMNLSATFLNGITTDGSLYLFATDFSAKKIYRICPSANTFNIMATTTYAPNGIYYDAANGRCVFVNWGTNAKIQAMAMSDSVITTLYTFSGVGNIDGITRDAAGYWYVSTWGGNALRMFDPTFSTAPTSVMTGLSSPADLDINLAGDSIGIPNSGNANNVVFYTLSTGIQQHTPQSSGTAYPVPATENARIVIAQTVQNGTCEVYDMTGKLISSKNFSGNSCEVSRDNLPNGTYMVTIREGEAVIFQGEILFTTTQ